MFSFKLLAVAALACAVVAQDSACPAASVVTLAVNEAVTVTEAVKTVTITQAVKTVTVTEAANPEGALANLLVASYFTKQANSSTKLNKRLEEPLYPVGTSPQPPVPIEDWRETAMFWGALAGVIVYSCSLIILKLKRTAEAGTAEERRARKNKEARRWANFLREERARNGHPVA